jgi:serine/threonine protein kinase
MMIRLIAADYHFNNLFHGDIKPDNILIDDYNNISFITSDIGSLLYLGEDNDNKFIVTCYTEKYASKEHIEAVNNKTPLTREQLMKEDKH